MAATPLSPASPEEAPPLPVLRQSDSKARAMAGSVGDGGGEEGGGGMGLGIGGVMIDGAGIIGSAGLEMRLREELEPPHPWKKPEENQRRDTPNEVSLESLYYNIMYIKLPEKLHKKSNPAINTNYLKFL